MVAVVTTKRKQASAKDMAILEFKEYLRRGGSRDPLSLRAAAFDRIYDKWVKHEA
jgi:hypothetical protein